MKARSRQYERELTLAKPLWPQQDQTDWDDAMIADDLAEENDSDLGEMKGRTPGNVLNATEGYFRFLNIRYPDLMLVPLKMRYQRWAIEEYVVALVSRGVTANTIVSYLERLRMAALRLGKRSEFVWLKRLIRRHRPDKGLPCLPPLTTGQLLKIGRDMMEDGLDMLRARGAGKAGASSRCNAIVRYRDGLIIATSALLPLRPGNFIVWESGKIFHMRDRKIPESSYRIKIPAHLVKTGEKIPRKIPDQLRADYDTYFDVVRPLFKGADQCAAIFMSVQGSALSYQGLYRAYTVELQRYANVHMSPQKARHAAANTAGKYGLAASKILQQNPTGSTARRAYQHDRPPATCQGTTAIFKL